MYTELDGDGYSKLVAGVTLKSWCKQFRNVQSLVRCLVRSVFSPHLKPVLAVSVYYTRGATQPDILQIHAKCVTILASVDSLKNASYLLPNVFETRSYQCSATMLFPSATIQPTVPQIFQQSCSHFKTLGASRVTQGKFHTKDP